MRFARVLQRENQTPYAFGAQSRVSEIDRSRIVRGTDSVELSERAKLLPKLGEMPPITPEPIESTRVVTIQQQHNPATGRVLDLYA